MEQGLPWWAPCWVFARGAGLLRGIEGRLLQCPAHPPGGTQGLTVTPASSPNLAPSQPPWPAGCVLTRAFHSCEGGRGWRGHST